LLRSDSFRPLVCFGTARPLLDDTVAHDTTMHSGPYVRKSGSRDAYEIRKRLGRKCLAEVACVAKPETILAWYRRLIARKFDGSKHRSYPGRPPVGPELEELILRMARENKGWGYDRIAGALANLGHQVSDQTIGNV